MTTKSRRVADTPIAAEQPAQGGSYVRQPDGTLTRAEFTDHPVAQVDAPADGADPAAPAGATDTGAEG
ncbi:MAG: hypothetical protein VYB32_06255 [Pseudomonadota bacterium]|nr:hypothetical protein [Pseudomonadota bacterium]